ncbi:hypothetical protein WDU94_014843 [Cyamophila willieti]
MLMPDKSSPPPTGTLNPAEELLSPASYSIDSGFSGSSSGTNSLGRNTAPIPSPSCSSASKSKKVPHKLWKRLPSISKSTSQINNVKPLLHGQKQTFSERWICRSFYVVVYD